MSHYIHYLNNSPWQKQKKQITLNEKTQQWNILWYHSFNSADSSKAISAVIICCFKVIEKCEISIQPRKIFFAKRPKATIEYKAVSSLPVSQF